MNIPTNITEICDGTFHRCDKLSNWDFGKSKLQVVGNDGFHSCFKLTSFNFSNLVSIGDRAFMCTGIKEICLHESITYLGAEAFERCTELTKVKTKIKCIPKLTFDGCSSLKSIEFTDLIEIGSGAFANCESLVLNNLPATVTSIGDGAFIGCDGIQSFTIPECVTSISDQLFSNCTNLTNVTLHKGIKQFGCASFASTGIQSLDIPEGVINIPNELCSNCTNLTNVTLHKGIQQIGCASLATTSIQSLIIQEGVINIHKEL